jgi:hypothetical protein
MNDNAVIHQPHFDAHDAPQLWLKSSSDCSAAILDPPTSTLRTPHQWGEQEQAEDAILRLERALAKAGFTPR